MVKENGRGKSKVKYCNCNYYCHCDCYCDYYCCCYYDCDYYCHCNYYCHCHCDVTITVTVTITVNVTITVTVTTTITLTLILYSYVRDDVHERDILHHHLPHSHGEGGSQAECHLTEHSGQQKHLRVRRRQK